MNQLPDSRANDYPRVYGYTKGTKIFLTIAAPLGTALFLWLAIWMFVDTGVEQSLGVKLLISGFALTMVVIFVLGLLESYRAKLFMYPDRLRFTEVIGEKNVAIADIEGFRLGPKGQGFYLILKDASRKKILIPSHVERIDELRQWLEGNFKNLDVLEFQAEEEKILANDELGATPDERKEKLNRVRKFMSRAKWPAVAITFWAMIYPVPYELAVGIAAILPMIGIAMFLKKPSLFRVDDDERSAYPSIVHFIMPGFALAARAIFDFNLVHFADVWIPFALVLGLLAGLLFWKSPEYHPKPLNFFPVLFVLAIYSFGLVLEGNCLLDSSEPVVHSAQVVSKRVSKGKHTSYYLTLTAWGTRPEGNEAEVLRKTYDVINAGDSVNVNERAGLLQIHWYYVRPRPK